VYALAAVSIPKVGAMKYTHKAVHWFANNALATVRAGLRLVPEIGDSRAMNTDRQIPAEIPV